MPILTGDIKLVASQVMDDVPEGGGAPTATVIQDGVSNAIFPDISELDRAGGRVNLRKLHVTVQTNDRDTYMGSNIIVAEPQSHVTVLGQSSPGGITLVNGAITNYQTNFHDAVFRFLKLRAVDGDTFAFNRSFIDRSFVVNVSAQREVLRLLESSSS